MAILQISTPRTRRNNGQGEIMWGFWQQLCGIGILGFQREEKTGKESFNLGIGEETVGRPKRGRLQIEKKITILPLIENTCLSIQKHNIIFKKMHIACNYKRWGVVHCSILNLMGQCAKHTIDWKGKV